MKNLKILLLNICSLYNKQHYLFDLINNTNSNVICLNETWLNCKIPSNELIFNGFNVVLLDRNAKRGGGSLILIKKGIDFEFTNSLIDDHIELINVSITINNALTINIILLYRPPNTPITAFLNSLNNFLDNLNIYRINTIVLGDFNIDFKKDSAHKKSLLNILKNFNLELINKLSTRNSNKTNSLIDLIFANNNIKNYILNTQTFNCHFSDHNYLTLNFNKLIQTKPKDKIKLLNYSHLKHITHDNTLLSNVCRSNNFKDFINHANTLIKNFVPVNYKTIKNDYFNSWITKDIVNEIRTKKALFKKYKIYKNTNLGPVFKNLLNNHKNICFNLIKKAKFNYYHKLFVSNYNNPKKRGKL